MGLLRLFLAMVVATDHFRAYVLKPNNLGLDGTWEFGMNAGHAVMCFYVVSGFLISYALANKYTQAGSVRDFYRSRAFRIYPLYWGLVALYLIIDLGGAQSVVWHRIQDGKIAELILGLTLIGSDWVVSFADYPTPDFSPFVPFMKIAWTLGAEMTFYLLAPLLLKSNRIAAAILIASFAWRIAVSQTSGFHTIWSYTFFPSTIMFFLLGHFARLLYERYTASLGHVLAATIPLALGVKLWSMNDQPDSPWFYVFLFLFAAALPYLFAKTKDSTILNYIGDMTYPLYLIHTGLITAIYYMGDKIGLRLIATLKENFSIEWSGILATLSFLLICVFISIAFARPYEIVLKKIFERAWKPTRKPVAAVSTP